MTKEQPPMKDEIESVIRLHRAETPIYSVELEKRFDISGISLREIIRDLRRESKPIANSKHGYYWALNYSEILPTIDDLESRAMSILQTVKVLRNCFTKENQLPLL